MCVGVGSRARMTLGQTVFLWGFLSQLSLSWSLGWRVLYPSQNMETKWLCWKKPQTSIIKTIFSRKEFHLHNIGLFWILHDRKTPQLWGFGSLSSQRQKSHVWKPHRAGLNFWEREMPNHSLLNGMWEVEINAFGIEKKNVDSYFWQTKHQRDYVGHINHNWVG